MAGGHDTVKSHTAQVGNPQTGEQLYRRSSPTGVRETSEPHSRLPSPGFSTGRRSPQSYLALKASRAWLQELHRTGGNKEEGTHKVHVHRVPGQKQWLHRSLGQTYLLVLEGLLERRGSGGNCGSLWGHKSWWRKQGPASILAGGRDTYFESLAPRPAPLNSL